MDHFLKKIKGAIEFWVPEQLTDQQQRMTLTVLVWAQVVCLFIGIGVSIWALSLNSFVLKIEALAYAAGVLIDLILMKINKIRAAYIWGFINANWVVLVAGFTLGRDNSMWVYFIANALASNYFCRGMGNVHLYTNGTTGIAVVLYMLGAWFDLNYPQLDPVYEIHVVRFGVLNKIGTLAIIITQVGQYYRLINEYKHKLELGAQALREQLDLVSSLLNNMKQAVFAIDKTKTVVAPVSHFSESIFKSKIEGRDILELFFKEKKDSELASQFQSTFDLVFDEDDLQWQLAVPNLPTELNVKVKSEDRFMKLSYNDIRGESGLLEKLMLVVEDVTELRELEKRLLLEKEQHLRTMQILSQVYAVESHRLIAFFKNSNRLIWEIRHFPNSANQPSAFEKLLQRNLHTLKGNARSLGLSLLSSHIHEIENKILEIKKETQALLQSDEILKSVENLLQDYSQVASKFVDLNQGATTGGSENAKQVLSIFTENLNRVESRLLEAAKDQRKMTPDQIELEFATLKETPLDVILNQQSRLVQDASEQLGKRVKYEVLADYFTLPDQVSSLIEDVLVHVLRNAVDHGIESPDQRVSQNKNETGMILVSAHRSENNIEIKVKDDGKGIDVDKVVNKALQLGWINQEKLAKMTRSDQLKLTLISGLSTQEKTNEFSGRGVGLDVVNERITELQGEIMIESELGKGTQFILQIPVNVIDGIRKQKTLAQISA